MILKRIVIALALAIVFITIILSSGLLIIGNLM